MTDTLLILAGGRSSRMKKSNATENLSKKEIEAANQKTKGMIELNSRPFMDYIIHNAQKAGIKNIIIITCEDSSDIREFYGKKDVENNFYNMKITYAVQYIPEVRDKPFGTADAVLQAMEQVPTLKTKTFLVCNCDNLYSIKGFKELVELKTPNGWLNYDRDGLIFPAKQVEDFAITSVNNDGYLLDIIEKPSKEDVEKFSDAKGIVRVSMNIFKFDGNIFFKYVKNCPVNPKRNEKELPTAILNMVKDHPKSMYGVPICEHVPDLTRKEDIATVKKYLKANNFNFNW